MIKASDLRLPASESEIEALFEIPDCPKHEQKGFFAQARQLFEEAKATKYFETPGRIADVEIALCATRIADREKDMWRF